MRVAVGLALVIAGFVLVGAANFVHLTAEAELLDKRPELGEQLYWHGLFRNHHLVDIFYKAEFPHGKRIRQYRFCALLGFLAAISGLVVIGFFDRTFR